MLVVVPTLYCVIQVMTQALLAEARPLTVTYLSIGRATVLLLLAVPLTSSLGIDGLAIAVLTAFVNDVFWRIAVTRRHLQVRHRMLWPWRTFASAGAAYVAGFGAAWSVDHALPGIGGLTIALAAGFAAFVVVLIAAGGLTPADRERLAKVRQRFSRKQLA
jgi:O-antigen/teichoic acid export membrane protein